MRFAHAAERIETRPGDKPEITGIDRQRFVNEFLHQSVERPGAGAFEHRLAVAGDALAVDDIVSVPVLTQHIQDDGGGILKIRIQHYNRVTPGGVQSGSDRHLVSKISGKAHYANAVIFLGPI